MKLKSNFMGNDTKINANTVAMIENNKGIPLDKYLGNLSSLNTVNKTSFAGAINEVDSKKMKKLWENPNPTNAFNAQEIALSNDDYDYLIIFFRLFRSDDTLASTITLRGYGFTLNGGGNAHISGSSSYVGSAYTRKCTRNSDTSFNVPLTEVNVGNSTTAGSDTNAYLIPAFIYGGKF